MCNTCDQIVMRQILALVAEDLSLEVAIRLVRDTVVQGALMDHVGQEAIDMALELSEHVNRVGEYLRDKRIASPDLFWAAVVEVAEMGER